MRLIGDLFTTIQKQVLTYEGDRKTWFYLRLSIVVISLAIWGTCLVYALLTKKFWLLWILLPSGGAITYILDIFFRRIGKRAIDFLLPNDKDDD
jgi:hypothetical protein